MGPDIDKLGKIYNYIKDKHEHVITLSKMKQSLKALRLREGGGPDGLSARLLNHISKSVPNLIIGAMQEINT